MKDKISKEETNLIKDIVRLIKSLPCTDCNKRYPNHEMSFDHLNPKTKKGNISIQIHYRNWTLMEVIREIAKTELVCLPCHRLRTINRNKKYGKKNN